MLVSIMLYAAVFYYINTDFFETAAEQRENGYNWEYVGRNNTSGVPALPLILETTNEEIIYYKLEK